MKKQANSIDSRRDLPLLWYLLPFFTLLALLNFLRFATSILAEGKTPKYLPLFIDEFTGAFSALPLVLLLIPFIRRFPIRKNNFLTRIPLHLLASVVFGICHTLGMLGSRALAYWILDLGAYRYGPLFYRIPMEYSHQLVMYIITYGLVQFISKSNQLKREILRVQKSQKELAEARLYALQMQLHPHFLFNTLHTVSSIMYQDPRKADDMLVTLCDLLRQTLKQRKNLEHTLQEEMKTVFLYLEIQRLRHPGRLEVNTDIPRDCQAGKVPVFLLQPLVENAITHGFHHQRELRILISASAGNGRMHIRIADNGPGMQSPGIPVPSRGLGLENTARRLQTLYGDRHTLKFQNRTPGGLEVTVSFPLEYAPTGGGDDHLNR